MDVSALPSVSTVQVGSDIAVAVLSSVQQLAETTATELFASLGLGQTVDALA